jgi:hypothetical protein
MHTLGAHARARPEIGARANARVKRNARRSFLEALERRAFTERQIRSVYKLKDFFKRQNLFILFEL